MISDRFDRFLTLAGALAGLMFFVAVWLIVVGVWLSRAKNTSPAAVQG